jgi:hypothetical protein
MELTSYLTDERTMTLFRRMASLFCRNLREAPEGGFGPISTMIRAPPRRRFFCGNRKEGFCPKLTGWKSLAALLS